jgi:alpha-ketoglutarate-dependent taurine dioxygenase
LATQTYQQVEASLALHVDRLTLDPRPEAAPEGLAEWVSGHQEELQRDLRHHGAVLFRNFEIDSDTKFGRCVEVLAPQRASYTHGNSPRTHLGDRIYTSTEYPSHLPISLHNELSYSSTWPAILFFACIVPATSGGSTPLADSRLVLERLDDDVRSKFEELGVLYTQTLHGGSGLGKSWQETFETDDPAVVEQFLDDSGAEYTWAERDLLVSFRRPGVVTHPQTHERVWFNQADQWHVTGAGAETAAAIRALLPEERYPQHAYFGDRTPIPEQDLDHVREVMWEAATDFTWERGDFLMVDNVLVAHGRRPFSGDRRILVALQ